MSNSAAANNPVIRYYRSRGSRLGYRYILGGTKHFGYYREGGSRWRFRSAMRRMEDELAMALSLTRGQIVLDAGCGMGDAASHLASKYGLQVHGIDLLDFNISEATSRAARRHLTDSLRFEIMDYSALTFDTASFSGVYTMETLVHARDAQEVLKGFLRVLQPGGHLALFEYTHDHFDQMSAAAQSALTLVNDLASMPSFEEFGPNVLQGHLKAAGFVDIKSTDITPRMLPMVSAFNTLARLPYWITKRLGRPLTFTNAMSAVELWNIRQHLHYEVVTARKPLDPQPRERIAA